MFSRWPANLLRNTTLPNLPLLRICYRSGLGVCGLIVAAWVAAPHQELVYSGARSKVWVGGTGLRALSGFLPAEREGLGWHLQVIGLSWKHGLRRPLAGTSPSGMKYLHLPQWLILALIALLTGLAQYLNRRLRIPPGCCTNCGYNLTGNVSGRCPECGTGISPAFTGRMPVPRAVTPAAPSGPGP